MKIAVISDTHGGLHGWESALFLVSKAETVIHCGDIFNSGYNPLPEKYEPQNLLNALNRMEKEFFAVEGNCETYGDRKMLEVPMAYPYLAFKVDKTRILATHGHLFREEELISLAKRWNIDILLTGHTHRWKIEKHENFIWLNPGSASIPKGEPSAALIDTDISMFQVFNLDTKEIIKEEKLSPGR